RRNGKNWYLAAITDSSARDLTTPLKFLGKGNWKVTLWEDAPDAGDNAEHLVKSEKTVRPSDTLPLKLAPSGGMVAIFSPIKCDVAGGVKSPNEQPGNRRRSEAPRQVE